MYPEPAELSSWQNKVWGSGESLSLPWTTGASQLPPSDMQHAVNAARRVLGCGDVFLGGSRSRVAAAKWLGGWVR